MSPAEPTIAFRPARVEAAWDETPSLRALTLALPDELGAGHTAPGQVLKLRARSGEGFFAIASAPAPGGRVDLLLKRGGQVADEVIAAAEIGASLEASAPFGRGFPVGEARGRDVLLFAAGSGISPIRALVQHLAGARGEFGRAALFYGQRDHEDFAFRAEHAEWADAGVHVVLCASRPSDAFSGRRGYVQDVAESLGLLDVDPARAVAFLCGMKGMVSAVREVLARAGLPEGRVYLNY